MVVEVPLERLSLQILPQRLPLPPTRGRIILYLSRKLFVLLPIYGDPEIKLKLGGISNMPCTVKKNSVS